jgi:hypothetical protein
MSSACESLVSRNRLGIDRRNGLLTARGGAGRRCERGRDEGVPIGQGPKDSRAQNTGGKAGRGLRASAECPGPNETSGPTAAGRGANGQGDALSLRADRAASSLERRVAQIAPDPAVVVVGTDTWCEEVRAFKRRLLESRLAQHGNNRAHTARSLGLPRTYISLLLRELELEIPLPVRWRG